MENEPITTEQTKTLDKLFDAWEGILISTDKDYRMLGGMFDGDN